MDKITMLKTKWLAFWQEKQPVLDKIKRVFAAIGKVLQITGRWIYRLRSVFLAIPVLLVALRLASFNQENLPEMVGINLQSTGEYAQMIERSTAVTAPLAVTALCLLMMFCSRRVLYPWIISIFSLVLPILIYATNMLPA